MRVSATCNLNLPFVPRAVDEAVFSLLEWFEHAGLNSQDEQVANLDALHTVAPKVSI